MKLFHQHRVLPLAFFVGSCAVALPSVGCHGGSNQTVIHPTGPVVVDGFSPSSHVVLNIFRLPGSEFTLSPDAIAGLIKIMQMPPAIPQYYESSHPIGWFTDGSVICSWREGIIQGKLRDGRTVIWQEENDPWLRTISNIYSQDRPIRDRVNDVLRALERHGRGES